MKLHVFFVLLSLGAGALGDGSGFGKYGRHFCTGMILYFPLFSRRSRLYRFFHDDRHQQDGLGCGQVGARSRGTPYRLRLRPQGPYAMRHGVEVQHSTRQFLSVHYVQFHDPLRTHLFGLLGGLGKSLREVKWACLQ